MGNLTPLEAGVAAVLGLWFALSCLNQFRLGWWNRWKRHDIGAVIPSYSFFAPNPGRTDSFLLYRDLFPDGSAGQWVNVDFDSNNSMVCALWNPRKRKNKAISDMLSDLAFLSVYYSKDSLSLTLSYLAILNFVTNQKHALGATYTEFVITESFGYYNSTPIDIAFQSGVHKL